MFGKKSKNNLADKWAIEARPDDDYIISAESAQRQIKAFLQRFQVDVKIWEEGIELLEMLEEHCRRGKIEFLMEDGLPKVKQVLVDENDQLRTAEGDKAIIIYDMAKIAPARLAADGYVMEERQAMQRATMGCLSGIGDGAMNKLNPYNLSVMECLFPLFMKIF
jgi:hypothetical protein